MGRLNSYKPAIAMVVLQCCYAAIALYTKAALSLGMSSTVFVVYRQLIATIVMAPLAFISLRRNSGRFPPLGIKCFGLMLLASLVGVTGNQNAYFEGLHLASSTAASAMTNLIPAITFVMATICGMEKVNIKSMRSIAKIFGTVCCVGGALCMALIKGPKLLNSDLLPPKSILNLAGIDSWLLGCLSLFASSFLWSTWLIMQVPISKGCPDHFYSSCLMCFLATLESAVVALLVEKDMAVWKLNSFEIGSCLFAGAGQAFSLLVQTYCISERGPLFTAMFNPLCTVIVAIIAAIILHEVTYTGSLVGALAVIVGLYAVLWGKAKDMEETEKEMMNEKVKNYQPENVEINVEAKKSRKGGLEEPFLSQKPNNNV